LVGRRYIIGIKDLVCPHARTAIAKDSYRLGSGIETNSLALLERVEIESFVFIGPSTAFAGNPHLPRPHTPIVLKTP